MEKTQQAQGNLWVRETSIIHPHEEGKHSYLACDPVTYETYTADKDELCKGYSKGRYAMDAPLGEPEVMDTEIDGKDVQIGWRFETEKHYDDCPEQAYTLETLIEVFTCQPVVKYTEEVTYAQF